ncbi:hypothetical protein BJ138DRAFT_1141042 [Hygrophoropsis aurantiaca]|uniref:Uncharacterized protein n=1 Tax=Hygrophoropsis aurantiaca TaxID=72124 RepID=A0ACB8ART1_9AGAM|nr:hypothetical protein BJ138DRAFT_1141042 [Hygrophoropsis aurantiaca]
MKASNDKQNTLLGDIGWCDGHGSSALFHFNGSEIREREFLRKISDLQYTFMGPDGLLYTWILEAKNCTLKLADPGSKLHTELAKSHPENWGFLTKKHGRYLEISGLAEHMPNIIVFTYLFVEEKRVEYIEAQAHRRRANMSANNLNNLINSENMNNMNNMVQHDAMMQPSNQGIVGTPGIY